MTPAPQVLRVFLPIVQKSPFPDLVVEQLGSSGGSVQLTIRNTGSAPATEPFWVDVYIDPNTPPVGVNQIWNTMGTQGLTWGVTADALPLGPGASLTLTVGDPFFRPEYSLVNGPVPAGTPLFAQVDSYNAATNYGAVREGHEVFGQPYNNIGSATAAAQLRIPPALATAPRSSDGLPTRRN
ncbi:MAG TPA: hypothetical protein VFS21_08035 [Roseiflexaceae bacterium]|nr:hypothetical protein [Roseiflexaceae bacterium]